MKKSYVGYCALWWYVMGVACGGGVGDGCVNLYVHLAF